MIKYENECCGCATPLYPCIGESCVNRHMPHYYCDECEDETELFYFDEEELCITCIFNRLKKVR